MVDNALFILLILLLVPMINMSLTIFSFTQRFKMSYDMHNEACREADDMGEDFFESADVHQVCKSIVSLSRQKVTLYRAISLYDLAKSKKEERKNRRDHW